MPLLALLISALIVGQSATGKRDGSEPVVQVGLFAYEPDGSVTARAVHTPPRLDSVVWASASLCRIGAGGMPAQGTPAHAWRFSGQVLSSTAEEAVVQLVWRRTVADGQVSTGPASPVQLTLRVGEPVRLDFASPTSSACAAGGAFEARYEAMRGGSDTSTTAAATGARRAHGIRGSGARRDTPREGAVRSGPIDPRATSDAGPKSADGLFEVNVWLVHTAPGRGEQARHQVLRTTPEGANFAFPPITIETDTGQLFVQIGGSFTITDNAQRLVFSPARTITFKPASGRTTVQHARGEGTVSIPMPGRAEVLAFELPSVRPEGGPAVPDQFAIRVRVTPL